MKKYVNASKQNNYIKRNWYDMLLAIGFEPISCPYANKAVAGVLSNTDMIIGDEENGFNVLGKVSTKKYPNKVKEEFIKDKKEKFDEFLNIGKHTGEFITLDVYHSALNVLEYILIE